MTTFLEYLPTDTQCEAIDVEEVGKLCETIHEAAVAVQEDPRCEERMDELESQCAKAARLLLTEPRIAPEIVAPLGEAAQTLYKADNIGPKVDLRVTETLGEIAAVIPDNVAERGIFVKIAMVKATEFFRQQHVAGNEVGEELDEKLLEAFEKAVKNANITMTFHEVFEREVADVFAEIEAEHVDTSEIAEYHRDQLLRKADRLASYAHNGRNVDAETTGVVIPAEITGPIDVITTETISTAPSHTDEQAYDRWKRNLASNITFSVGRQAMRDDEFERIATTDDMAAIRAELDSLYSIAS